MTEELDSRSPFFDFALRPTVFIAGSGRSGTTWLAELLANDGQRRILFEPFAGWRVPEFKHFDRYLYLGPDEISPWFERPTLKILRGKIRHPWVDQLHNGKRVYWQRIIKDVYSNIRLGWLQAVNPNLKIILIVRHPCAVAASQLRHQWKIDPDRFLRNPALIERHFSASEVQLIKDASDPLDRSIITWCVENRVPRSELGAKLTLVHFEHLHHQTEQTLEQLSQDTGIRVNTKKRDLNQLSALAGGDASTAARGKDPTEQWMKELSPSQIKRAGEILAAFQCTDLYATDAPNPLNISAR